MVKQLPNNQQAGFTLIELIMVIVVLGALAVTALPRYVDLEAQAHQGSADGIAGTLAAGAAINFATCKAGGTPCVAFALADDCQDLSVTVQGGVPAGFAITAQAVAALDVTNGYATCIVAGTGGAGNPPVSATANFQAMIP